MVPLRYNLRNLTERKGTTIMTAVGIALTVGVLVTTIAMTIGMAAVFSGSGHPRQALVMRDGANAELSSTVKEEYWQIIRHLPGIARTEDGEMMASPEGLTVINLPSIQHPEGMNLTVRGMLPIGLKMRETATLTDGRWNEPGKRELVAGAGLKARYPDARVGQTIRFGRGEWTVVGEFIDGESSANSELWTDLNQLHGDFEQAGGCNVVLIRFDRDVSTALPAFQEEMKRHQELKSLVVQSQQEYFKSLTNSSSGMFLQFIGFFVAIVMAVGAGFAATNTMYAAVARRSREIGTLRALGFGRGAILLSFVTESVCLSLIGGVIGCVLVLPINNLSAGIGNFATFSEMSFKFKVTPVAIVSGLLFAAMIGLVGGFLPAYSASRKNIVAAMRDV